jgi:protease I
MQITTSGPKRVAILIDQKFEDCEFQIPYNALKQAGARVAVLGSRMNEKYRGKQGQVSIKPDGTVTEARPEDFDAVIIPGGMAPDVTTLTLCSLFRKQWSWVSLLRLSATVPRF